MTKSIAESERLVLGACLLSPDNFDLIAETLTPNMFSTDRHQLIHDSMLRLYSRKKMVTRASVKHDLGDTVDGQDTEGLFSALTHEAVKAGDIPVQEYGENIAESWKRAYGSEMLRTNAEKFKSKKPFRSDDILSEVVEKAREIMSHDTLSPILTPNRPAFFDKMAETHKRGYVPGVPIPLPEIQYVLSEDSFRAGNLYGLLSSSGEGKTSLTMQTLYHAAIECHPTCFFSYDQSEDDCLHQMIAQVHGIEFQRQIRATLSDKEWQQCKNFADWFAAAPFKIVNCTRQNVSDLVKMSREFQKKYGRDKTTMFCVDHIGKIKTDNRERMDEGKRAGSINVELKAFIKDNNATFLVLNQRNSYGMRRDNPRPISSDLYGGEGAKADYDSIVYLYRKEKFKAERLATVSRDSDYARLDKIFGVDVEGKAEIGALKVRFGNPSKRGHLTFDGRLTKYTSTESEVIQMDAFG